MVLFRFFACDERWCFLFDKCVLFSRLSILGIAMGLLSTLKFSLPIETAPNAKPKTHCDATKPFRWDHKTGPQNRSKETRYWWCENTELVPSSQRASYLKACDIVWAYWILLSLICLQPRVWKRLRVKTLTTQPNKKDHKICQKRPQTCAWRRLKL